MAEIQAYKIVEVVDGKVKTLFHGLNGSRTIPSGVWLKADQKLVSDGGSTQYVSGWHVLTDYDETKKYLGRFKTRTDILTIVPCVVKNVRPKKHSPSPVLLAEFMKLI